MTRLRTIKSERPGATSSEPLINPPPRRGLATITNSPAARVDTHRVAFRYYDWAAKVATRVNLSPYAKVVAFALARHANAKTGQCNPSQKTLAEDTGRSPQKVCEAVSELKHAGCLTVHRGRGNRARYELILNTQAEVQNSCMQEVQNSWMREVPYELRKLNCEGELPKAFEVSDAISPSGSNGEAGTATTRETSGNARSARRAPGSLLGVPVVLPGSASRLQAGPASRSARLLGRRRESWENSLSPYLKFEDERSAA